MSETIGAVTHSTILIFNASFRESRTALLKRAALLFDRILLPTPQGIGSMDRATYIRLSGNVSVSEVDPTTHTPKYHKLFLDVADVTSEPERYNEQVWGFDGKDLWGTGGKAYEDHVSRLVKRREIEQFGDRREAMKFYLPHLAMDIRAYSLLLASVPGAVPLVTPYHSTTIEKFFVASRTHQPERTMKSLLGTAVPDFGELTWGQVLELREDRFLKQFRAKVHDLSIQSVHRAPTTATSLRGLVDKSLWAFLSANEPKVAKTVVSAVIGNLPFPLPISPLGIATSAADIADEIEKKREFGWLMFVNRLRAKVNGG